MHVCVCSNHHDVRMWRISPFAFSYIHDFYRGCIKNWRTAGFWHVRAAVHVLTSPFSLAVPQYSVFGSTALEGSSACLSADSRPPAFCLICLEPVIWKCLASLTSFVSVFFCLSLCLLSHGFPPCAGFSQLCSSRRAFSEQGPLRLIKSASFFAGLPCAVVHGACCRV